MNRAESVFYILSSCVSDNVTCDCSLHVSLTHYGSEHELSYVIMKLIVDCLREGLTVGCQDGDNQCYGVRGRCQGETA